MASAPKNVWAIDLGNSSLKAVCFRRSGDKMEIVDSLVIEHKYILSAPGVDEVRRQRAISESVATLAQKRDLHGEEVILSVSGQTSFSRFIKLPPVDKKKIPKMVQFEAQQQIPFDIHEVEWDYQLMTDPDSPDASVGIFAIKNELIASILSHYSDNDIRISCVQMSPIALYNFASYEYEGISSNPKKATILLDIGTDNTNLVICSGKNIWQRCIPMGGNSFTQAIADAFKINFDKAEKLKRGAQASKYAKQIFQAMRPVYTKISEEVQRSVNFFLTTNNVEFSKVVAVGGGFRLQGVAKFLQQSLGVKFIMPSDYKKVSLGQELNAAKFHESVLEFAVAYGLGVQAFDEAAVDTNLLPRKLARTMIWKQKSGYLNIAAAMILIVGVLAFVRAMSDRIAIAANRQTRTQVQSVLRDAQEVERRLSEEKRRAEPLKAALEKYFGYLSDRDFVPAFVEGIVGCLPDEEKHPDQAELFEAFRNGDLNTIMQTPRNERKQIFVTSVDVSYTTTVANTPFGDATQRTRRRETAPAGDMFMDDMGMMGEMGMMDPMGGMGPGADMWGMEDYGRVDDTDAVTDGAGFLVVLEGFIPYKNYGELMDPPGVSDDKSRWGFITYLENFAEVYTRNKFKLFEKDSSSHFVYEDGVVDLDDRNMPQGIGVEMRKTRVPDADDGGRRTTTSRRDGQNIITHETVLVDPMTGEEMSRTLKLNERGEVQRDAYGEEIEIVRDHWFRIKAKFLWKDAPESDTSQHNDMGMY